MFGLGSYNPEQLRDVVEDLGITATSKRGARKAAFNPDMPNSWTVTLHYAPKSGARPRSLTVDFFGGSAVTHVDAADVLYSIVSDARAGDQSFEDFCSDFGYDPDSRQAEKIWKACRAIAPKVHAFLGGHFDRVAEAEH